MKYRFIVWIWIAGLALHFGCSQPEPKNHSVEGIWVCTPETAYDYPESRWITALLIGEAKDGNIEARGCFMWDGSYLNPWELEQASFNDSTRTLTLVDSEGNRYEGLPDPDMQIIRGYFWSDDPGQTTPIDTVDFIRADSMWQAKKAEYELVKYNYQKSRLVAPFSGIVIGRMAEPGQTIRVDMQPPILFRLADESSFIVEAEVTEVGTFEDPDYMPDL